MKKNKIKFVALDEHTFIVKENPTLASKLIPKWWKDIPKYTNGTNELQLNPFANVTVKQCAPTIDILSSGYMITLWADVVVTQKDGYPYASWTTDTPVLSTWSLDQSSFFEIPSGFNNLVFKLLNGWSIKTPKGWSCLFIHPIGYQNLPIRTIAGLVDTDILDTDINCPFVIKEGFEGIIPKGTPIAQIIPIKRANWESEVVQPDGRYYFNMEKLGTKIYGFYASLREKKSFK
jgi:hypothetical protein